MQRLRGLQRTLSLQCYQGWACWSPCQGRGHAKCWDCKRTARNNCTRKPWSHSGAFLIFLFFLLFSSFSPSLFSSEVTQASGWNFTCQDETSLDVITFPYLPVRKLLFLKKIKNKKVDFVEYSFFRGNCGDFQWHKYSKINLSWFIIYWYSFDIYKCIVNAVMFFMSTCLLFPFLIFGFSGFRFPLFCLCYLLNFPFLIFFEM